MAITTSTKSASDVANQALVRMGYKLRIGSMLDGSEHAGHILDVYGQTRDALLGKFDYDFAERTVALALLKSAPAGGYTPVAPWDPATNPPPGFFYEYGWPTDAVKIRSIKRQPTFVENFDPRPNNFTEYNDKLYTPSQRTILSNVPDAICVYTGRITDPIVWSVQFVDALAAELALILGPVLVGLDSVKVTGPESAMADAASMAEQR